MQRIFNSFTLAETLITVVILGILAAILVPNLIKNQVENANRTKVKKAMAAYEKAINFMIVENDIKSTEALRELGQDNCQYTREYFKTVQDGENNCIFKTTDRVWWNITDITNPILILKDEQIGRLTTELRILSGNIKDNTVFSMVGRFDDMGTLRINDNAYEQGLKNNAANRKYVRKLWYFITQSDSVLNEFDRCSLNNQSTCTITANGVSTTYTKITTTSRTSAGDNHTSCIYNREKKTKTCGHVSTAYADDYWISDNLGVITEDNAKSKETCDSSVYGRTSCSRNGDYYEASRIKCEKSGGRLATLAELEIARQNGKLNSGTFWAYEEYGNSYAYVMDSNGNTPTDRIGKNNPDYQVICVGNN